VDKKPMKSIQAFLEEAIERTKSDPKYLYHYSAQPRKEILTREAQGNISKDKLADEESAAKFRSEKFIYSKHVSLTFDHLPLDIILKHFPSDHHTYKPGTTIYRHDIYIPDLEDMYWKVGESPLSTFMGDYLWMKLDWYKKIFFKLRRTGRILNKEEGQGTQSMLKASARYSGTYRHYFQKLVDRPDFQKMTGMYAPNVPHIFLYPPNGKLIPKKIEKVKL